MQLRFGVMIVVSSSVLSLQNAKAGWCDLRDTGGVLLGTKNCTDSLARFAVFLKKAVGSK